MRILCLGDVVGSPGQRLLQDKLPEFREANAIDFALGRPVLYIDTPRKINNPEYQKIDLVPLEESIRIEIGDLLAPEDIGRAVVWLCRADMVVGIALVLRGGDDVEQ